MQPGHVNLGRFLLFGFAKYHCGTFQKMALPLRNLVCVYVKLLGKFGKGLSSFKAARATLALMAAV
jgi:hypothetical protein